MSSLTLANIELLGLRELSDEASTFKRWITVNGPMKTEYLFYQIDTDDVFTDGDTTTSRLAHPYAAEIAPVNTDLTGTAFPGSVTLDNDESSATFKTITIHDCEAGTMGGIIITIQGY